MTDITKRWDENWEDLQDQDNLCKEAGQLLGRFIDEPYADGKAFYQIIRVFKKKVKIQVVTEIGDDWVIPYWGETATIDKDYAIQNIERRDALSKLFGGE